MTNKSDLSEPQIKTIEYLKKEKMPQMWPFIFNNISFDGIYSDFISEVIMPLEEKRLIIARRSGGAWYYRLTPSGYKILKEKD